MVVILSYKINSFSHRVNPERFLRRTPKQQNNPIYVDGTGKKQIDWNEKHST